MLWQWNILVKGFSIWIELSLYLIWQPSVWIPGSLWSRPSSGCRWMWQSPQYHHHVSALVILFPPKKVPVAYNRINVKYHWYHLGLILWMSTFIKCCTWSTLSFSPRGEASDVLKEAVTAMMVVTSGTVKRIFVFCLLPFECLLLQSSDTLQTDFQPLNAS